MKAGLAGRGGAFYNGCWIAKEPCGAPTLALFPQSLCRSAPFSWKALPLLSFCSSPFGTQLKYHLRREESILIHKTKSVLVIVCAHSSLHFFFKSLVTVCNYLLVSMYVPTWLPARGGQQAWHRINVTWKEGGGQGGKKEKWIEKNLNLERNRQQDWELLLKIQGSSKVGLEVDQFKRVLGKTTGPPPLRHPNALRDPETQPNVFCC